MAPIVMRAASASPETVVIFSAPNAPPKIAAMAAGVISSATVHPSNAKQSAAMTGPVPPIMHASPDTVGVISAPNAQP